MVKASSVVSLKTQSNSEPDLNPQLVDTLGAFAAWRTTKTNSAEPIPDHLWHAVFQLEAYFSRAQLRRYFHLNTTQYTSRRNALLPNNEAVTQPASEDMTGVPPLIEPPTLCEVTVKNKKSSKKANPYASEPLPSAKTLIVEFCRSDGQIMKIHTTQDSIPTLIKTFLGGA